MVVAYRTSVATRRAAAQVGHTLRVLDLASDAQAGVLAAFPQALTARERLLAEQTQAADEANAALQLLLISVIVSAAAVGVGVAWLLAWHLTRPVALLARTARAISDGDLSRRVKLA